MQGRRGHVSREGAKGSNPWDLRQAVHDRTEFGESYEIYQQAVRRWRRGHARFSILNLRAHP